MNRRHVLLLPMLLLSTGCGGGDGGITNPTGTGTLSGLVSGPGGPIPGAQVALSGGGSQQTNADGRFSFAALQPGPRTVTITPPGGFLLAGGETAAKSATVAAGATATVDWSLRLSDTSPRTVEVGLTATTFSSADVTVPVGSTINWVNQTAVTHTISPNDPAKPGSWPEETITGQGTEFDHTFASLGTFDYVCKLHAGMTGVVRVH